MSEAELTLAFLKAAGDDDTLDALERMAAVIPELNAKMDMRLLDVVGRSWHDVLHPDVLNLPPRSVVGAVCLQAVMKCDLLTSTMTDAVKEHHLIRLAVGHQCDVWLFG